MTEAPAQVETPKVVDPKVEKRLGRVELQKHLHEFAELQEKIATLKDQADAEWKAALALWHKFGPFETTTIIKSNWGSSDYFCTFNHPEGNAPAFVIKPYADTPSITEAQMDD